MSASEGMYDVALKPKLLRSLLREYVPDERHTFSNPSEMSYVVATVKTHKLLSEWTTQPVEQDLVVAWKSAVDAWVHRLLTLASSNLPDKCWAGICLLGLACQECSSERFLTSYAGWLDKLLSRVQPPEVSNFVKAASCASLSDLITRLSGFSNAKKDGTSHAAKVIQPALKLLNGDSSAVVLEQAICLLCTMINFFPLSVNRHYDSVEAAVVSKIMSGKCSASVMKKLAYGLALLPKSRVNEDSWSLMMDKILLNINSLLNEAFQGLEEEARSTQTMRVLLPSGKEPPPPLGGLAMSEQTLDLSTRRPERLLGSGISTLMQCCCHMLTSSYPVMVPVPVCSLIALAGRVLMVDGSPSLSSYSSMTTLKQEFICSEIPIMHLHSLDIIAAVVKVLSSLLLPHVAGIVQLLQDYLWTCKIPDLKIKAYSILKVLLMSMGIGTAVHISQDIVNNVCIDLDEKDGRSSGSQSKVHQELSKSRKRKRKHSFMAMPSEGHPDHDDLEVEKSHNLTPISVKIAALEVLEALLTTGGSMKSESWRGNVDHLLITVATNASRGGWSVEENNFFLSGEPIPTWIDFQLAALRALLASLLSPGRTRPSHLALGLELFHRVGMQETGTKISKYCGHALLSLEVLIHPRALPLLDSSDNDYKVLNHKSHGATYHAGRIGEVPDDPESEDDDLNEKWLGNDDDEMETQIAERQNHPENARNPPLVEFSSVKVLSSNLMSQQNEATVLTSGPKDKSMADIDVSMSESLDSGNITNVTTGAGDGGISARSVGGAPEGVRLESPLVEDDVTVKSDVISEVSKGSASTPGGQVSGNKDDECSTIVERISAIIGFDNELPDDSLPDIVDADPDSD
ncbi:hypothetical protein OROGR_031096 [Orobanche gracilis]